MQTRELIVITKREQLSQKQNTMFYRRKIILGLLQILGGKTGKIQMQKLLFLLSKMQTKPEYEFVPYLFGCYSFSANADITSMLEKGFISEDGTNYIKEDKEDYIKELKEEDKKKIQEIKQFYGRMSANDLMKYTYLHYPYWATKSKVAEDILDEKEYQRVKNSVCNSEETVLFTIGYEGTSLEGYFNKLLRNNIKLLIDVRCNAISMKYGFSKSGLKSICEKLGIEYIHFPEVGISSDNRQSLKTQADYDELFLKYKKNTLLHTTKTQEKILLLLKTKKRIALTCFEADICQCHRKHLADKIASMTDFNYKVKHI